jgi:segregation and condensation protein A
MLLPATETDDEEDEGDPRAELVEQLLEYKMYKYMSYELRDRQIDSQNMLYKEATIPLEVSEFVVPIDVKELVGELNLIKLNDIFQDVMKKQVDKVDPVRSRFGKIEKEEVTVPEKLEYVSNYAKEHKRFRFRELLLKQKSKTHIVTTFLAILELMKNGEITVVQENLFDDIWIEEKAS